MTLIGLDLEREEEQEPSLTKSEQMSTLFPVNEKTSMKTGNQERFKVNFANIERYKKSTIPYLQRMLNSCESEKNKIIRNVGF